MLQNNPYPWVGAVAGLFGAALLPHALLPGAPVHAVREVRHGLAEGTPAARIRRQRARQTFGATRTIHITPNLSFSMPKRSEKNVSESG